MSTPQADNVRRYRRRAGLSQEQLANASGLSYSVVRKLERGGTVRVETLHALARTLSVPTSALLASDAPQPVGRAEEPNRLNLIQLRTALTPPVGLADVVDERAADEPDLRALRRTTRDGVALYHADAYRSIAATLPALIKDATSAVAHFDSGKEREHALLARAEVLQLAGKYLTQVRQYDLAYTALSGAIADARAAGSRQHAASGVVGLCWLLLRQGRLDDAEHLAVTTADAVEPKFSKATAEQSAVWGCLVMRAAAAAVRNNRPGEAREYRKLADTAASAVGREHSDDFAHWGTFGPVTVAMKTVEDHMIVGDSRSVVRKSEGARLSPKAWRSVGKPSPSNWNRHRLDVALAHVRTGDLGGAMEELTEIRHDAPEWLRHQNMARQTMVELLKKRKRTLTADMRGMAGFLDVAG